MPYRHEGERLVFDARTPVAPEATVKPGEMPQPGDPDPVDPDQDDEDDEDDGDEEEEEDEQVSA